MYQRRLGSQNRGGTSQWLMSRETHCAPGELNLFGRVSLCFVKLMGCLVACHIFSTFGDDRRFVNGGYRTEFAYAVPQLTSDSSSLGLLQEEERFEKIKSCGTQYIIDAIDDIHPR